MNVFLLSNYQHLSFVVVSSNLLSVVLLYSYSWHCKGILGKLRSLSDVLLALFKVRELFLTVLMKQRQVQGNILVMIWLFYILISCSHFCNSVHCFFFYHLFLCGLSRNSSTQIITVVSQPEVIPWAAGANGEACLTSFTRRTTLQWSKVQSTFWACAIFDNQSIERRMCFPDLRSGDRCGRWMCGNLLLKGGGNCVPFFPILLPW